MDIREYMVAHDGLIVSDGTCRDGDLLRSFLPIIDQYLGHIDGDVLKECYAFLGEYGDFGWLADLEGDVESDDLKRMEWIVSEWMWDEMNAIAPDGFYFGANAGDGACFGFWKCDENEYQPLTNNENIIYLNGYAPVRNYVKLG